MSDIQNQPCNTEYSFPHRSNPFHYLQGRTAGLMWGPVNPNMNHNIQLALPELEIQNDRMPIHQRLPPNRTTANGGLANQVSRRKSGRGAR